MQYAFIYKEPLDSYRKIGRYDSKFYRKLFYRCITKKTSSIISVFTSAYKSGQKIMRPFNSLRKQTQTEWEWIILDDSPEEDKDATWNTLKFLAEKDCRIRIFK